MPRCHFRLLPPIQRSPNLCVCPILTQKVNHRRASYGRSPRLACFMFRGGGFLATPRCEPSGCLWAGAAPSSLQLFCLPRTFSNATTDYGGQCHSPSVESGRFRRPPPTSTRRGAGKLTSAFQCPLAPGGAGTGRGCGDHPSEAGSPSAGACTSGVCSLGSRKKVGREWEGAGARGGEERKSVLGPPPRAREPGWSQRPGAASAFKMQIDSPLPRPPPARGSEAPPLRCRPRLLRAAAPRAGGST